MGPRTKDSSILGLILGSHIRGNYYFYIVVVALVMPTTPVTLGVNPFDSPASSLCFLENGGMDRPCRANPHVRAFRV